MYAAAEEKGMNHIVRTALCALLAFAAATTAQTPWPDQKIKLVVPYPPGGLTDTLARSIAEPLAKSLGQPVVIENKPGAGTLVGAQAVARSAADGYTLLMATSTTLAISPALYRNNMIEPVKDFAPVSLVASVPFFMVTPADTGWNSVRDVVEASRKAPAPLQYGSAGGGSPHHLAMEMLQTATGVKFDHIPYRGSQLAIPDLLSGRFRVMVTDLTPALAHIRSGKLKVLATTAPARSVLMPEVPTFAEAGYPAVQAVAWQGVVAPAGTPKAVIDRLATELGAIVRSEALKNRCLAIGCEALTPTSPAEFTDYVKTEAVRWSKIVADSGAKAD
jgi:tripartite-type tricarboxylate transporter receptor subunit TctC